jgi:hypothetical protein
VSRVEVPTPKCCYYKQLRRFFRRFGDFPRFCRFLYLWYVHGDAALGVVPLSFRLRLASLKIHRYAYGLTDINPFARSPASATGCLQWQWQERAAIPCLGVAGHDWRLAVVIFLIKSNYRDATGTWTQVLSDVTILLSLLICTGTQCASSCLDSYLPKTDFVPWYDEVRRAKRRVQPARHSLPRFTDERVASSDERALCP